MRYLSICSGIEAASVAWQPLDWTPLGFAEIEKFPSAVLSHHYGSNVPGDPLAKNGVPNFGDIQGYKEWPLEHVNILVGGTPCQSFSVAGLRRGLEDPRGNLALTYVGIADKYKPKYVVWENVPGVLSQDGGRAFGSIVGALAELGYHIAYRILDAQYVRVDGFGRAVPQRRRRVFVVGHSGDWRRAAAVLFERESLSWDSPPRREAGKGAAPTLAARTRGGGGLGTDFECDGGLIAQTVANPLTARMHKGINTTADEGQTMVAHALRADGFDASEDGTGRGTPLVPVAPAIAQTLTRGAESAGKGGYAGRRQEDDSNLVAVPACDRWAVRRLTPRECERLQGFPDGYTDVPYRGKPAADGPRYKALGNSMAVNVMRWIGRKINAQEQQA